jgi:uncharacterized protein with PQ loop repeat
MEKQLDLHGNKLQTTQRYSLDGVLNSMMGVIAIIYPLTAVPQLIEIWVHKNVAGVSLLTWGMFMLFSLPIMIYCIKRKEKKMALMYTLWMGIYVAVISGVVLFS